MKYNKHYASAYTGENYDEKYRNGLPADKVGHEGTDMFIQDPLYLKAYALYFSKFIEAYKKQGIPIFAVMPQNEFNSAQIFPSCCWTSASWLILSVIISGRPCRFKEWKLCSARWNVRMSRLLIRY